MPTYKGKNYLKGGSKFHIFHKINIFYLF